jgi:hypothetical protein
MPAAGSSRFGTTTYADVNLELFILQHGQSPIGVWEWRGVVQLWAPTYSD